ncbi:hypothetical protein HanIR_Chr09g0406031 [Helianthus annuus]|nr:hypothetical protein HanIR_Chr09g0406031 [Helianthus annuus]
MRSCLVRLMLSFSNQDLNTDGLHYKIQEKVRCIGSKGCLKYNNVILDTIFLKAS